jgi:hypothetical protein
MSLLGLSPTKDQQQRLVRERERSERGYLAAALKFQRPIWSAFTRFLRTRCRALPSERTVKEVLAQELTLDFHSLKPSAMMQEIHRLGQRPDEEVAQEDKYPRKEPQVALAWADCIGFMTAFLPRQAMCA